MVLAELLRITSRWQAERLLVGPLFGEDRTTTRILSIHPQARRIPLRHLSPEDRSTQRRGRSSPQVESLRGIAREWQKAVACNLPDRGNGGHPPGEPDPQRQLALPAEEIG